MNLYINKPDEPKNLLLSQKYNKLDNHAKYTIIYCAFLVF